MNCRCDGMSFHVSRSHGGVMNLLICLLIVLVIVRDSFDSVSRVLVFIIFLKLSRSQKSFQFFTQKIFSSGHFFFFLFSLFPRLWDGETNKFSHKCSKHQTRTVITHMRWITQSPISLATIYDFNWLNKTQHLHRWKR